MQQSIIIPGLGGVEVDHWQSRWNREQPNTVMVQQRNWDQPDPAEWIAALDATIRQTTGPVVVIAHSLGCHTLAHWATRHSSPVRAALLVAPPDIDHSAAHGAPIACFGPPAPGPLPFPAMLAASRTDPWSSTDASRRLADQWGAQFVDLGDAGHVNTESGHGPWPEGNQLFHELLRATDPVTPT
jgi:serine hydrolase